MPWAGAYVMDHVGALCMNFIRYIRPEVKYLPKHMIIFCKIDRKGKIGQLSVCLSKDNGKTEDPSGEHPETETSDLSSGRMASSRGK